MSKRNRAKPSVFLFLPTLNVVLFFGLLWGETAQHCTWFALIPGELSQCLLQSEQQLPGLAEVLLEAPVFAPAHQALIALLLLRPTSLLQASPAHRSFCQFHLVASLLEPPFIQNRPTCVSRSGRKWLLLHSRASLRAPKLSMSVGIPASMKPRPSFFFFLSPLLIVSVLSPICLH